MKRPHAVVVASKNPDKIAEIEAVLGALDPPIAVLTGHTWADVDETEDTLEGNATLKAEAVLAATGHASVADDTGLEVPALGGAPGVMAARYAGPEATYDDNVDKMLREMGGVTDRRARFRTVVVLMAPDGGRLVVEGRLEGTLTTERRGTGGFGYDPIFEVDGRTLAEIPIEEKNAMSHRARALLALAHTLGSGGR